MGVCAQILAGKTTPCQTLAAGMQDDGLMQEAAGVGFIDVGVGHPCTQLSSISTDTFQSWIETFYSHLTDHVQQACKSIG